MLSLYTIKLFIPLLNILKLCHEPHFYSQNFLFQSIDETAYASMICIQLSFKCKGLRKTCHLRQCCSHSFSRMNEFLSFMNEIVIIPKPMESLPWF